MVSKSEKIAGLIFGSIANCFIIKAPIKDKKNFAPFLGQNGLKQSQLWIFMLYYISEDNIFVCSEKFILAFFASEMSLSQHQILLDK
jgi:hypothetical protein